MSAHDIRLKAKNERTITALMKVAVACSKTTDPVQHAHVVLAEIISLFGAEKAELYLSEELISQTVSKQDPKLKP